MIGSAGSAKLITQGAISAANLAKESSTIKKNLSRIINYIKNGRVDIVVFGPGGVGKSTLGTALTKDAAKHAGQTKYNESPSVERRSVDADFWGTVLIPPGQGRRRDSTWTELFASLSTGKAVGVINVVANGWHSFDGVSYKNHRIYTDNNLSSIPDFMGKYREEMLLDEIRIIRDLEPYLVQAKRKIWMITLVTKQDLWWQDRDAVMRQYETGPYREVIDSITNRRGKMHFDHHFIGASLVTANLRDVDDEVMVPTAEGYDTAIFLKHYNHLVETILNLSKQVRRI